MRKSTSLLTMTLVFLAIFGAAFFSNQYLTLAEEDLGDYRYTSSHLPIGSGALYGVIDTDDVLFHIDYYFFQAQRGVNYTFVLDQITVEDANLAIVNSLPRGNEISPDQELTVVGGRKTVTWTARTTDTYYVEVSGGLNDSDGTFNLGYYTVSGFEDTRFADRHSDGINGATEISTNNLYQGAISPWTNQPSLTGTVDGGDDFDFFSFRVQRGARYVVEVELGTSEGVEIAINSSFGVQETNDGIGNSLDWISPIDGTYYISVSGTNRVPYPSGTYSLKLIADTSLIDQHGQSFENATAFSFGNAHQGSISPASDLDYFTFSAERGVRYVLDATLGTAAGIELSVLDSAETSLASNGGVGTSLEWLAPSTGNYVAVVSASSRVPDVIGTYQLSLTNDTSLRDRHGELSTAASALTLGIAVPGAISPKTDQDYFSFPAERGVNYSIAMEFLSADGTIISIEDPAGETIVSTYGLGTGLSWTADSTGVFYVVVEHSPLAVQGTGTYSLKVDANTSLEDRHLDSELSGTSLSFGTVYQGAISPKTDLDYFSFDAERGVEYTLDLTYGSATAVSLELNSLAGRADTVTRNFGEDNIVRWIASESATYYIKISESPTTDVPVGTYALKVTNDTTLIDRHSDSIVDGTLIGFGNAIAGAISPLDDYDYFRFQAEEGVTYTVDVTLGTAEGVRFSVENRAAEFSVSNFGLDTTLDWEAPEEGWYTLAVSASGQISDPSGTYNITVSQESDALPPAPRIVAPSGTAIMIESRVSPTGSIVRVPLTFQDATELSNVGFTLKYDPNVLRVISVEPGSRLTPETFSYDKDTAGKVRFGFDLAEGPSSGGTAAVVEFEVVGDGGSVIPLTLTDGLMTQSGGGASTLELLGADFRVGAKIRGDGNGDSLVTALDALIALQMASGILDPDLALDINGDGFVTINDARSILNMARPS